MAAILTISDLDVRYGTIPALSGLSLSVEEGSLTALLGANGAGKSTTLNTVAGLLRPTRGRVTFQDRDITGRAAHRVTRAGLALVPEGRLVVAPLTVLENLELSAFARGRKRTAALVDVVFEAIKQIHAAGVTVLLVEQNASIALPLADQAYLIHRGDIIAAGTPEELDRNPDLVARHLGLDPAIAVPELERAIGHHEPEPGGDPARPARTA